MVKQDQMRQVNLEEKGEEKIVKVSAQLEDKFKKQLLGLL